MSMTLFLRSLLDIILAGSGLAKMIEEPFLANLSALLSPEYQSDPEYQRSGKE